MNLINISYIQFTPDINILEYKILFIFRLTSTLFYFEFKRTENSTFAVLINRFEELIHNCPVNLIYYLI